MKGVLILLAAASVVTWTIWLARRRDCDRQAQGACGAAPARGGDFSLRVGRGAEPVEFLAAVGAELRLSTDTTETDGFKERVASRLERIEIIAMCRQLRLIGLVLTFLAPGILAPDMALAEGGYMRPPQLQPFRASLAPSLPTLPAISLPAGSLIGGCGPKRYHDPQSHRCRGPADLH